MTDRERDELYDVVWAGNDGLIGDRETKWDGVWSPPRRLYNWSGKFKGQFKSWKREPKGYHSDAQVIDQRGVNPKLVDNLEKGRHARDDIKIIDIFGENE